MTSHHRIRAGLLGATLFALSWLDSASVFARGPNPLADVGVRKGAAAASTLLPNPILFVAQFPVPTDFGAIGSVFANHRGDIQYVGRGGDLYIVYPDGVLRNL